MSQEKPESVQSVRDRVERRFQMREDARIPFPMSQDQFAAEFPELAAVWEEWFPLLALKLARSISGNLMLVEDAGGWGELMITIERHRVTRVGVRTSSKYENGRRRASDEDDREAMGRQP